jgi:hypothetical protein
LGSFLAGTRRLGRGILGVVLDNVKDLRPDQCGGGAKTALLWITEEVPVGERGERKRDTLKISGLVWLAVEVVGVRVVAEEKLLEVQ